MGVEAERVDRMAGKLTEGPKRSAFVEGAARLDRIARPTEQSREAPPPSGQGRMTAVSPDEAWARRFMSQGIGPGLERPAPAISMPDLALVESAAPAPMTPPRREFSKPGKPVPIGVAIGKPVRRSWLGRLIRGG
jgi:hypothetical protein